MSHRIVVSLTLIFWGTAAYSQQERQPDPLCVAVANIPIPKSDLPPRKMAETCDDLDLYYSGNYRQARYCAYSARDITEEGSMDAPIGNGVLAMIYAQGKGVPPNLRLAERFACEMDNWDAQVAHSFEEKRLQDATTAPYDLCRQPDNEFFNYACALTQQSQADAAVKRAERLLNEGRGAKVLQAFQHVRAMRRLYETAMIADDPNGTSGAVHTAMYIQADREKRWAESLDRLRSSDHPQYSTADYSKADAELNAAYQQAISTTKDCKDEFCLNSAQLIRIERSWIAFRDAWITYAKVRWPSEDADAWRTWLTLQQTECLKGL